MTQLRYLVLEVHVMYIVNVFNVLKVTIGRIAFPRRLPGESLLTVPYLVFAVHTEVVNHLIGATKIIIPVSACSRIICCMGMIHSGQVGETWLDKTHVILKKLLENYKRKAIFD